MRPSKGHKSAEPQLAGQFPARQGGITTHPQCSVVCLFLSSIHRCDKPSVGIVKPADTSPALDTSKKKHNRILSDRRHDSVMPRLASLSAARQGGAHPKCSTAHSRVSAFGCPDSTPFQPHDDPFSTPPPLSTIERTQNGPCTTRPPRCIRRSQPARRRDTRRWMG